jgi:hypothetical protein
MGDRWSEGHGWSATNGRPPAAALSLTLGILLYFFHLNLNFLEIWGWAWHFGRMGAQQPNHLKVAPTLGSVKSSITHGAWRFYYFSNFILLKLEKTWTFISTFRF